MEEFRRFFSFVYSPSGYRQHIHLLFLCALTLAIFGVYSNVYQNGFLWDDEFLLQRNLFLRSWDGLWPLLTHSSTGGSGGVDSFYRPIQGLAYFFIYRLFGLNLFALHFFNVLVHWFNALLIYKWVKSLWQHQSAGFIAAFLWAVHPVHVEAVTYLSATADVLSTFFFLTAVICYRQHWVFSVLTFILAVLTKESATILPAVLVLLEFWPQRKWHWSYLRRTLIFWLITLSYLIARHLFSQKNVYQFYATPNIYTENLHVRVFTFLAALGKYFELIFFPHDLHMERLHSVFVSPFFAPVFLVILGLALLAFVLWRRRYIPQDALFLGVGWFLVAFIPMSGIILPVNSLLLEHWLYLPSIGVAAAIGFACSYSYQDKAILPFVFLLAGVLGWQTFTYNKVWRDPATFYRHILSFETGTARVHNNLAMELSEKGDFESAKKHCLRALEIDNTYPQTHYNLALIYFKEGNLSQAEEQLKEALALNADFFYAHHLLASIYESLGRQEEAINHRAIFEEILRRRGIAP